MNARPPIKPRIVRAGEKDIHAISELASVIWRACYPGIITNDQIDYMLARMYSPETLQEEICSEGIHYELLHAGDQFIGFASYGLTGKKRIVKLHKLYLHHDWHGRGLGSLLLRHCETEALKLGAHGMILSVNKRNSKAIRAYERNGFRIVDSIVTDIGGGFVMDDYAMEKRLV